jgi:hypothetical protein
MLSIIGQPTRSFCDHVSRRDVIKLGAMGMGGLTLADLLRAESQAGSTSKRRSIINICLPGGPSHLDMFDLKPDAPQEIRGEFRPIATNVSGMEICELFPKLAGMADKFAVVRSISDFSAEHTTKQADSGWPEKSLRNLGGRPGIGAIVSKVHGPRPDCPLTSISMGGHTSPGYLGQVFKDYQPDGTGRENLQMRMSEERLNSRVELLASLDHFGRQADTSGSMKALDSFSRKAVDLVTSGKIANALDVDKEDPKVQAMYAGATGRRNNGRSPFLTARRLVEAGVRVVSFTFAGWDTHSGNFTSLRQSLPAMDIGLSALMTDLEQRGLLDDTIIMMSGEFGRTPRVNMTAGRDHWPAAGFLFVAGGGLKGGQMIGSTNRYGERPLDRPVKLQEVYSTVFHQLGIDVGTTQLIDPAGRPQYLFDHRELLQELI